jgi:TnpA family transposase
MITQRQPGPAIDGVLGQQLSKIARVYTDTHGYSAYGGSLGWTMGVLLCPRLKNHNDRRLHVPSSGIHIPHYQGAARDRDASFRAGHCAI